jgi:lipopolysaccharide export system protein LptA
MTVYYAGETTSNSISKIDVDGNVLLATPRETARGNSGNYDVKNDFVVLNGNVVLTKDKNVLKGTRLDYDIKNGRSKLIGATGSTTSRVQALFVPEEKK